MRVKRGTAHVKRRKYLLRATKGFKWGRKNQLKKAKEAATKAGRHAYKHRRLKKREYRALWQVRINAAAHLHGLSYSQLIHRLTTKKVALDRKILAQLAIEQPEIFTTLVDQVK